MKKTKNCEICGFARINGWYIDGLEICDNCGLVKYGLADYR